MSETPIDGDHLRSWIGKSETVHDVIHAGPARAMQATLDQPPSLQDGDALPGLWNWLYFRTEVPMSGLGRDGHAKLGGFLPPVPLPRRMWAGGRFRISEPLRIGQRVERKSTILKVSPKAGQSGALCFVTVGHDFSADGQHCFSEEHDIVYREDPAADAPRVRPPPAPAQRDFQETVTPGPVLLFRYSALTFNGHRIHYDRDYCINVEGYDGLVVHGPLIATMLFQLATMQNSGRQITEFSYRAVSPLLDTEAFRVAGSRDNGQLSLWAETLRGELAMSATASFA